MSYKDNDFKLWNTWNETKDKKDLSKLMRNMKPLIHHNINPLRGTISDKVLETEAKLQAMKAFNSYNPQKEAKLATHVTNHLQKVNRLVYNNMDLISIPEARRIKYKNFEAVSTNLEEENGRPATIDELADELGWSHAEVRRFQSENWKELSDSHSPMFDAKANDDPNHALVSYVYNDLSPKHKKVFEMVNGYGGKKEKSNADIMKKLKLTQGQLSYAKTKIRNELQKALGQYGQ